MENVTLELIKGIKDRFKYPIITIYAIVLILWNWDVLSYYVFSDSKIEDKITYIEKHFNQNWSRILYPLFKAILLAVLIPVIMLCIEYLLQKINGLRREIKFKNNEAIRDEKLAVAEHEFKIEQERTGKKTIEEWQSKVDSLQQKLDIEKLDVKSLSDDITELKQKNIDLIEQNKFFEQKLEFTYQWFERVMENINENFEHVNSRRIYSLIEKFYHDDEHGNIVFQNELTDIDKNILTIFVDINNLK